VLLKYIDNVVIFCREAEVRAQFLMSLSLSLFIEAKLLKQTSFPHKYLRTVVCIFIRQEPFTYMWSSDIY